MIRNNLCIMLRMTNSSSKVIIGVRSGVHYIQLLFILKMIQAVFSTSLSVLYQMTTRKINDLSMRFKRQWSITFMNYYHMSKSCFIFLMEVGDSIKITKTWKKRMHAQFVREMAETTDEKKNQGTGWEKLTWKLKRKPCCVQEQAIRTNYVTRKVKQYLI